MINKWIYRSFALAATMGLLASADANAQQNQAEDQRLHYYDSFHGKKVVFVPVSMGFDLTELWAAQMRRQAQDLGYGFDILDPNGSGDAGAKAITALISEKPSVIVVQNLDVQVYARLLKRANEAGIKVIQVNMMSLQPTDSYVGIDYVKLAELEAKALVDRCDVPNAVSHKVALIYSSPTDSGSVFHRTGWHKVLDAHPQIQIVAEQAANADPSKARSVMETVLQQNPDLCGVVGVWDGQDSGIGTAVQQAGKSGQILVVTSGGGTKEACENIEGGLYGLYFSYDAPRVGSLVNQQIAELLQNPAAAGSTKISYYMPLTPGSKQSVSSLSCWRLDRYR